MNSCYKCRKEIPEDLFVGRQSQCPSCGVDLHCCLNCSFYDIGVYNDCREPQAERVLDKIHFNFCDFFKFKQTPKTTGEADSTIKNKLEDLFKKNS
jgi:hypothetical protein